MITAQYKLTKEHEAAGLELKEYADYLLLERDNEVLKLWYWQNAFSKDVLREANRYLEKCPSADNYEPYDICELNGKVCSRNTGNALFDVTCNYYIDFLNKVYERKG